MIMGYIIIKLWRNSPHLSQILSTNKGEVMVLIVIPYMESEPIQRSVVTISLLFLVHDIMLGDEMTSDGMDSHTQQSSKNEVGNSRKSKEIINDGVESDGGSIIKEFPLGWFLGVDKHGSNGIKQWLQKAPEDLAGSGVEEPSLDSTRDINIHNIFSLETMMFHMITLETN